MTLPSRPHSARLPIAAVALLAGCLLSMILGTAAGAASPPNTPSARTHASLVRASAARLVPPRLRAAAAQSAEADRAFVSTARALRRCVLQNSAHPKHCNSTRRALQRTGLRLRRAQRLLALVALRTSRAGGARATTSPNPRVAPSLSVSGDTLAWTRVANLNTYVFVRKVPGQPDQYSVVTGNSLTPPPVPGATVRYSVRTTALGAAWAPEVSITYPASPVGPKAPDPQAAPALTVSGQTLTWSAVANIHAYILATKVPGRADQYSVVSGTSTTPPAVPGATVRYGIRTAVEGSAWAPEVTITYPALQPSPPPPEEPASTLSALQIGLNSGTEAGDLSATATLGAKLVRVEFPIGDTAAQLEPAIAKYAAEGVRVLPLAGFSGRMPTPAEAHNLATWAAAYGPGGTFWAGRSDGSLAIRSIEVGNETDYSGQYHDEPGATSYRLRAEAYAVRVKEAAQSIQSAGSTVGLLVQADDTSGDWMNGMYAAVPDLTKYVAGWTMHPYGGREYNEYRYRALIRQATEHGASSVPIDVTEWGVTTDNGRCLEYNDGLNRCMTYQEAGQEVRSSFAWMKEMLGSKLVMFIFYQSGDQSPTGVTTNWQGYFGALRHDLQPKGAYTEAVEALLRS
jgi:hypothetical protein